MSRDVAEPDLNIDQLRLEIVHSSPSSNLVHKAPPEWLTMSAVHLADAHRFRETDTDVPTNEILLKTRRFYHQIITRDLRRYSSYILLILTWFEGPYSCEFFNSFPIACTVGAIPWYLYLIESICVTFIFFTSSAKLLFEGLHPITHRRFFNYFVSIGSFLHLLLILISFYEPSVILWVLRNFLRPVYLADQFRAIRLLSIIHAKSSLRVFLPVSAMLLLFVCFFSSFAQLFFGEHLDGERSRDIDIPFIKVFSNMFVMITTTNFPDVTLPAYKFNFFSYIFFGLVMVVVYFVVSRVLIAIFYDAYKMASKDVNERIINHQIRHIHRAFAVLCEGEKYGTMRNGPSKRYTTSPNDRISLTSIVDVTMTLFPYASSNLPRVILSVISEEDHHEIFDMNEEEFTTYINCLFHVHQVTEYKIILSHQIKQYLHWLGLSWVKLNTPTGKRLYLTFCSKWTDFFLALVALTSFMTYQFGIRQSIDSFQAFKLFLDILYLVPVVIGAFVMGFKNYFSIKWNCFEFTLSFMIMGASIANFFGSAGDFFNTLVCLRLLSIFRMLYLFSPPLKDIFDFIAGVGFITFPNFLIIYLIVFYWALLGVLIFGNTFTYPNPALDSLVGWNRDYYSLNFNDFGHSMTILFACLVINNWQIMAWTYSVVIGLQSVLYFGAFYLSTAFGFMNIVLGFMLDAYFSLKEKRKDDCEEDVDRYLERITQRLSTLPSPEIATDFIVIKKVKVLRTYKRGFYEVIKLFG